MINLRYLSLVSISLLLESFSTIVIYFSRFFYFIDDNRDFHQDHNSTLLKTTQLIYKLWETDEFVRFKLVLFIVYPVIGYVSSFFLFLPCVLCVASLVLSFAFTLWLLCNISCLVSCLLAFYSRLSIVVLLVFSHYIISLDKHLYIELIANRYNCFIWRCWASYILYLLFLHYVLCIMSFAFALYLIHCRSHHVFCFISCQISDLA